MAQLNKLPAWSTPRNGIAPNPQAQRGGYGYRPAAQPRANPQSQAGGYGYRGPNTRAPVSNALPAWAPQRTKQQAGYYQTGPDERRTVNIGGQDIRMGPNSYIAPPPRPVSPYQDILDAIMGRRRPSQDGGYFAGVRG